jgi:hypothetical protein
MPSPLKPPVALVAALILLVVARPAEAYLDPGTGSIVLQAVIATVAAAAVALKLYWTRLKSLFGRKRAGAEEEKQPR